MGKLVFGERLAWVKSVCVWNNCVKIRLQLRFGIARVCKLCNVNVNTISGLQWHVSKLWCVYKCSPQLSMLGRNWTATKHIFFLTFYKKNKKKLRWNNERNDESTSITLYSLKPILFKSYIVEQCQNLIQNTENGKIILKCANLAQTQKVVKQFFFLGQVHQLASHDLYLGQIEPTVINEASMWFTITHCCCPC